MYQIFSFARFVIQITLQEYLIVDMQSFVKAVLVQTKFKNALFADKNVNLQKEYFSLD